MNGMLFLILWSFALILSSQSTDHKTTTEDIILKNGYPCEVHTATTDDGYILTMHRIPGAVRSPSANNKPVVFLQHGLLDSSFTWVNNPPNESLAFILADLGYDVWLGNTRGNVYSRAHETLSPSKNAFWDFTWDEMAKYDFPAMINFVLEFTNVSKLHYVGHSQGNEIAFAKLSENGPINAKIASLVALAPVAYLGHMKTAVRYLRFVAKGFDLLGQILNHGEFLPNDYIVNTLKKYVCRADMSDDLCNNILFMLNGYQTTNINQSRLSIYLSHIPTGTSSKNIVHYVQSYESNKFQMYDYGFFGNLYRYHSIHPPTYPLNTFGVPIAIFYGSKDNSATPIDATRTISELGANVVYRHLISNYSHIDFLWGFNAADLVYKDLITFIRKYQ